MKLSTKKKQNYKRFTSYDMEKCIAMKSEGLKFEIIGAILGFTKSTISRNLKIAKEVSWGKIKVYQQWKPREKFISYSFQLWKEKKNQIKNEIDQSRKNKIEIKWGKFVEYSNKKIYEKILGKRFLYSPYAIIEMFKQIFPLYEVPKKSQFYNWIHHKTFNFRPYMFISMNRMKWKKPSIPKRNPKYIHISERPEYINNRSREGDMEIDTVEGLRTDKKNIATIIDRRTRKVGLEFYKGKDSSNFKSATDVNLMKYEKVYSITMDNGTENSKMGELSKQWNFEPYNTNPYASYEKGSVETMHKFIRRFLPKNTSFNNVTNTQLKIIENFINQYPRKII